MVEGGDVVWRYLERLFEHDDGLLVLLGVFVGETLAVVELWISRHDFDGLVKISVGALNLSQRQVGVTPVEECLRVVLVEVKCLVVLRKRFLVLFPVVERKSLVVVVCGL